jgi:hypothetical protein
MPTMSNKCAVMCHGTMGTSAAFRAEQVVLDPLVGLWLPRLGGLLAPVLALEAENLQLATGVPALLPDRLGQC